MASKVVTLYIDDTTFRLLVARGKRVKKCAELPLEPGVVKDGVVLDEVRVAARLKDFLKAEKVKARRVVVGLSGVHTLYTVITLPRISRSLLSEAVKREAERAIPVPLDQLHLSWQLVRSYEDGMQVFLAAVPRNIVDTAIGALQRAGLQPYLVDLSPLALARVANGAAATTTSTLVVDVRSAAIDMALTVDGVPELVQSISLAGKTPSVAQKLPAVKEEIERAIKFYNSTHAEKPLKPGLLDIFISGDLEDVSEMCQTLANDLTGYNVLPLSSPLTWPTTSAPTQYMVNVGLALKQLSLGQGARASVVNLNILPDVHRPKPLSLARILVTAATITGISLLTLLLVLVQNEAVATEQMQAWLNTTNRFLEVKNAVQQSQKAQIADLEKRIAELDRRRDALVALAEHFRGQQESLSRDLRTAMSNLPGTITLSKMSRSGGKLTMDGAAPSENEVLVYAASLRESQTFSEVMVTRVERGNNDVAFTLTLTGKGVK